MNHLTYLYATSPFESNFDISALDGARICTRENWVYTGLTASFEQDSMVRVDTNSLKNMATMLIADRCDYMVMSNDNAVKMFSYPETCNKAIYQSPMPTSEITLHIVVRSSLNAVKAEIDDAIRLFKQTGSFMQSYQIHGQRPQFPKPSSC